MRFRQLGRWFAATAWLLFMAAGVSSQADEPVAGSVNESSLSWVERADWQGSNRTAQLVVPPQSVPPAGNFPPINAVPPSVVVPPRMPQNFLFGAPAETPTTPLIDDGSPPTEELLPPLMEEEATQRQGVQPYGGGHPSDWSWGCGGSPYRTGPGMCDNWKVGCGWHVAVDGIVMSREETDLAALAAEVEGDLAGALPLDDPMFEQFDYGPGGRVTFISQVPHYVGYQMHAAYEGIEEWNASIVYERQPDEPPISGAPGSPTQPVPEDFGTEQRSLHYRSSLHSGELNFVRNCHEVWRPYCGVRYVKFDDEINDFINQEAPPPLPGEPGGLPSDPPREPFVTTTDRLNLIDLENNLIGFQVGVRHDFWRKDRRFSMEGFANTGVYYNKIKYTNLMGVFRTQEIADNTSTDNINEARIDFSNAVNNDVREYSEIAYHAEASLSGVCRLNKCWALRAGYQALWINNVLLADDAFLNDDLEAQSLFFHGWHAGVECRR